MTMTWNKTNSRLDPILGQWQRGVGRYKDIIGSIDKFGI